MCLQLPGPGSECWSAFRCFRMVLVAAVAGALQNCLTTRLCGRRTPWPVARTCPQAETSLCEGDRLFLCFPLPTPGPASFSLSGPYTCSAHLLPCSSLGAECLTVLPPGLEASSPDSFREGAALFSLAASFPTPCPT